jgi:hypothetical protein
MREGSMDVTGRRPSASLVISFIALAVAISGTAVALPGKNKVETNDIEKNAVTSKKIKKKAVTTKKVKNLAITASKLADGSVTGPKIATDAVDGAKVAPGSLTGDDIANNSIGDGKLSEVEVIGGSYIRATATDGADEATARAAAPEIPLFQKGQLELYAKCFRNVATDETRVEVYGRTSADGSILDGQDNLPGGPAAADFLNPGTPELDRQLDTQDVLAGDAMYDEFEYALASPDGTGLIGQTALGVKGGNLAGGNGIYGDGNVCLIQGTVFG